MLAFPVGKCQRGKGRHWGWGEGVRGFDFEGLNLTFCPFPVLEHWGRVLDYRRASCMKESILSQHYTRSLVGVNLWVVQWFVHTEEGGVPPRDL